MNQLAKRYATALYDLAIEENKIELWQKQMKVITSVFNENEAFLSIFAQYQITYEEKKEMLKNTLGSMDHSLLNFLYLLVDCKRMNQIINIAESFQILCNQSKNVCVGVLFSARPLNQEQIRQIEEVMSKEKGQTIELINQIDSSLISGIKVKIEDEVWDASLKNRIHSLKNELMKESR